MIALKDTKRFEALQQKILKIKKYQGLYSHQNEDNNHLSMRIRSTILYSNKALMFRKFNGMNDTCIHLCIFFDKVSLITMDDDLHEKLFPLFLKGEAT